MNGFRLSPTALVFASARLHAAAVTASKTARDSALRRIHLLSELSAGRQARRDARGTLGRISRRNRLSVGARLRYERRVVTSMSIPPLPHAGSSAVTSAKPERLRTLLVGAGSL